MWTLVRVLLGSVLLLGPRSGWGCDLPATGQTTCWDSSGNDIPCAGTGQDGELQEGAPLAYVDNADGTITDVNTTTTTTSTSSTITTTRPPTTSTTTTTSSMTSTLASTTMTTGSSTTTSSTIPTFIQGAAFSSSSRVSTATVPLTRRPVAQGDLLVGWVSQYDAAGQVQVADNVNGAWTRAPRSLTFMNDGGDIALYYRENSQAAPSGLTITVSASSATYLQGAVAEYSGIALAGSLDQVASARAVGTAVDTGATGATAAGEVVFAALVTGGSPGSVTPGSSLGLPYTPRAQTASGSSCEEDITSSAAGAQHGTAILGAATDWYAVCAVFRPYPATPPVPPSTPTGLKATSVASTRVALAWSPASTGDVAGYTVYRDGAAIGTTVPGTTIFLDPDVTPSTTHAYAVDAFDLVNGHSARSAPLTVTTPAVSPEFVQGAATSSGERIPSETLTLTAPVLAGDLLVGWFSQFDAPGQVQVSDDVNGPWTPSVSTTFGGKGDIALYYRENSAPAPSGLAVTITASVPTYLQAALADYRNMAGALDQAMVSEGVGTEASVGPSAPVPAGELVVAAVIAGGEPGAPSAGSSQMVPYFLDVWNGSASSDLEDIMSSAAGPQQGSLTLGSTTNWFMVLATFRPATTTVACGDVNGDGVVNIGDALLTAQYDVGLRHCGEAPFGQSEVCDVNGDGACDIGDALRIAQCDVGLVSCVFGCRPFPCP